MEDESGRWQLIGCGRGGGCMIVLCSSDISCSDVRWTLQGSEDMLFKCRRACWKVLSLAELCCRGGARIRSSAEEHAGMVSLADLCCRGGGYVQVSKNNWNGIFGWTFLYLLRRRSEWRIRTNTRQSKQPEFISGALPRKLTIRNHASWKAKANNQGKAEESRGRWGQRLSAGTVKEGIGPRSSCPSFVRQWLGWWWNVPGVPWK